MSPRLSESECRVLARLADGSQFKAIAPDLGVSVNTAKTYAKRAYRKLGVRNRHEAVVIHSRLRDHYCAFLHLGPVTLMSP